MALIKFIALVYEIAWPWVAVVFGISYASNVGRKLVIVHTITVSCLHYESN